MDQRPAPARLVTVPAYLKRFTCIGPACEDNCCAAGWSISIDRPTFTRYQALDHAIGPSIRAAIVANSPETATTDDFARIKLDDTLTCPLLTADRLCGIQATLGAEFLSDVCLSYPRDSTLFDDRVLQVGLLSCPEIARLALFEAGALELASTAAPFDGRLARPTKIRTKALSESDPRHLLEPVRHALAGLIGRRSVPWEGRLRLLGRALESLTGQAGRPLSETLAAFSAAIEDRPGGSDHPWATPPNPLVARLALDVVRQLTLARLATGGTSPRFRACTERVAPNLDLDWKQRVGAGTVDRYLAKRRDLYDPYLRDHPQVLENYVLNQIYAGGFPFGGGRTPSDEYAVLIVRLALIRLLIVGAAAGAGAVTDELVVEVVQSSERALGHNADYLDRLVASLKLNGEIPKSLLTSLLIT